MLPKRTVSHLVETTRRLRALEKLTTTDRDKIGSVMYKDELEQALRNFVQALDELVDDRRYPADMRRDLAEFVLPGMYRASVQTL